GRHAVFQHDRTVLRLHGDADRQRVEDGVEQSDRAARLGLALACRIELLAQSRIFGSLFGVSHAARSSGACCTGNVASVLALPDVLINRTHSKSAKPMKI